MLNHAHEILSVLELFARGGGGGSGGGGGGAGGGGGGVLFVIAMIGYVPANYVTSWFHRNVSGLAAYAAGIFTAVAVTSASFLIAGAWGIIVGAGAIFGVYSGSRNLVGRIIHKIPAIRKKIQVAAAADSVWHETHLIHTISETFYRFQLDWANFDIESIRTYTTARYCQHVHLMLYAMQQMDRQNKMERVQIGRYYVADMHDADQNDQDHFRAYISASADDTLWDNRHQQALYTDSSMFYEFWRFKREGDAWKLDGIDQQTADAAHQIALLQAFAEHHGMFYSPDMGWLLMPQRGELFGKANFKHSDINNHIIGNWQGHIVQLYTYIPYKARQQADNYLVGQIALPKSYGGIIIRRRSKWFTFRLFPAPKGYQPVSMEWPDFNKRYDVYATDMDKVTSFELLNPAYMAKLYDQNLPINIEVVDNVIYFYSRVSHSEQRYAEMLDILQGVWRELYR